MGCRLCQNLLLTDIQKSQGIYKTCGHLRKSQWKFDVNHRRHNFRGATTEGIYESSGYLRIGHLINCSQGPSLCKQKTFRDTVWIYESSGH